jgi:hypothetical protein
MVIINVSLYRYDVMIVETHQIRSFLPIQLKSGDINSRADAGDLGSPQVPSCECHTSISGVGNITSE